MLSSLALNSWVHMILLHLPKQLWLQIHATITTSNRLCLSEICSIDIFRIFILLMDMTNAWIHISNFVAIQLLLSEHFHFLRWDCKQIKFSFISHPFICELLSMTGSMRVQTSVIYLWTVSLCILRRIRFIVVSLIQHLCMSAFS